MNMIFTLGDLKAALANYKDDSVWIQVKVNGNPAALLGDPISLIDDGRDRKILVLNVGYREP